MIHHIVSAVLIACTLLMPAITTANDKHPKKAATVKEVKAMSEQDQTALALSAAPAHIAKEAGIMIYGADGKLTETRKSANGFTCMPTVMNLPDPDPVCMDAWSFFVTLRLTEATNHAACRDHSTRIGYRR